MGHSFFSWWRAVLGGDPKEGVMNAKMSANENFAKLCHDIAGDLNILDSFFTLLLQNPTKITEDIIEKVQKRLSSSIQSFRMVQQKLTNREVVLEDRGDFHIFAREYLATMKQLIDAKEDELQIQFSCQTEELPDLNLSPMEFRNIFTSLFDNSIDAQRDYQIRHCEVSLTPSNGFLKIRYRDFGDGISEEDLPKIFDKNFTTKSHGSGFGLFYVKNLLAKAGGVIRVSSSPGEGTCFELEIPICNTS